MTICNWLFEYILSTFYLFELSLFQRFSDEIHYIFTFLATPLLFFFTSHTVRHKGSYFPNQGSNLCPLYWKHRVLTTGREVPLYRQRTLSFSSLGHTSEDAHLNARPASHVPLCELGRCLPWSHETLCKRLQAPSTLHYSSDSCGQTFFSFLLGKGEERGWMKKREMC